jgi:hypothetical protein
MFRCLFGIALFAIAPPASAETVWWRTTGAAVIQLTQHDCSLFNYNNNQAVIVKWSANGSESLAVQDSQYQYDNMEFAVLVELGNKPLDGNLTGTGEGNIVTIDLPQPIDDQLRSAATVEVHLANVQVDHVFQFTLAKQKMPALLTAVSKCRAIIR